eukprot:GHVL01035808.1.p1 GENE.GHVL01035808.1~~GHVL01035808.1.p1  ORF type:complete len:282 (-),score=62.29 GHVL01035808.1:295-1140(-)
MLLMAKDAVDCTPRCNNGSMFTPRQHTPLQNTPRDPALRENTETNNNTNKTPDIKIKELTKDVLILIEFISNNINYLNINLNLSDDSRQVFDTLFNKILKNTDDSKISNFKLPINSIFEKSKMEDSSATLLSPLSTTRRRQRRSPQKSFNLSPMKFLEKSAAKSELSNLATLDGEEVWSLKEEKRKNNKKSLPIIKQESSNMIGDWIQSASQAVGTFYQTAVQQLDPSQTPRGPPTPGVSPHRTSWVSTEQRTTAVSTPRGSLGPPIQGVSAGPPTRGVSG